jgi:PDZ domain-containing protein
VRALLTPVRLALLGLLALGVAFLLFVAFYPTDDTYIFLPDRARPVDPLVDVQGERPHGDGGGIYFVDILVRRATLLERWFPSIREGSQLVPAAAVNPTGVSEAVRREGSLREMTRSQRIAAAVSLRELGYKVRTEARGALVDLVAPGRPAARVLHPGDVIVAVDGQPVRSPDDLRRLIAKAGVGRPARLTVRRGSDVRRFTVRPVRGEDGRPVIGVLAEEDVDIRLPRRVQIDAGGIGGPSAGLAFALDVLEELGRDVDRGHKVAVTGELGLDGSVRPIGGVRQKTIGARRAGVDLFIVPAGDNAREARRYAHGLRIVPVRSFQQALRVLATLRRKPEKPAQETLSNLPEIATFSLTRPLA